jgi:hypothetical protein
MDDVSSSPVTDPAHRGKSRRRRQLKVLLFCVLIATIFWFLRAFENEYTTRVDHPVSYINLPDKMMTINPLPQRISLEVKGLGFSILKHNWNFSKTPLVIDIRKLRSMPARRKKGFIDYLPMYQYYNDFSAQLKDLKVLAIIPDTLMFRFAFKKARNVKVMPVFTYESGSSIIPDSLIRVVPDSIMVEGPDLIIDTLKFVKTLPVKVSKHGGAFSRSLGLQEIHKMIKMSPVKVTVSIDNNP